MLFPDLGKHAPLPVVPVTSLDHADGFIPFLNVSLIGGPCHKHTAHRLDLDRCNMLLLHLPSGLKLDQQFLLRHLLYVLSIRSYVILLLIEFD